MSSLETLRVDGDAGKNFFQTGPAMIIENRGPLICALIKPERPGVRKAEGGVAAYVLIVSLRETSVLVLEIGFRTDEVLHFPLVQ